MSEKMDFGEALALLKKGKYVARSGWNGRNMRLHLQVRDANSKMTASYIYLTAPHPDGHGCTLVPWVASQTDLLSDDWHQVLK